jgi:hypothetical protein
VGETKNLVNRFLGDIAEARITKGKLFHSLNRYLKAKNPSFNTEEIKRQIEQNYLFSYVPTTDKSIALACEGILIKYYRDKGQLINKR